MNLFRSTAIAIIIVVPATKRVHAQTLDTSAVQVVAASALTALSKDARVPVLFGAPRPWVISVDSLSPEWRLVAERFHLLLRTRPPVDKDTLVAFITFDPIRVRADSLSASFTIGVRVRCSGTGRFAETTASHSVEAVRQAQAWLPARTIEVVIGDGFCGPGREIRLRGT
jgi:hypothetical protein